MTKYYKIDNVEYIDMIVIILIIMTTKLFVTATVTETEIVIVMKIGYYAQSMP